LSGTAIFFGVTLILVGVVSYIISNFASVTALIPAFIGGIIALMGLIAQSKESLRKHAMHVAVLIGLLGFIGTAVRWIPSLINFLSTGAVKNSVAFISQTITALLCLAFVILCVKSFVDARRNREA
jgi:hypothetical protein